MSSTSTAANTNASVVIDDETVLDYLRTRPDFFRQHPALLAELDLPHASGGAVSLIERQVAILRERSINSRHKLGELMEIARDNDQLFQHTRELVLQLITASSTTELFDRLAYQLRNLFAIEISRSVLLCDSGVVEKLELDPGHTRPLEEAHREIPNLLDLKQAYCGTLRDNEKQFLFADAAAEVGSAAICSRVIAEDAAYLIFSVSHRDSSHYDSGTGTLFVEYLADVLQGILKNKLG